MPDPLPDLRRIFPLTDERRAIFLKALEESGSLAAAARAASPHCSGPRGGYETFRDAARREPEFALAVRTARERALGLVEKTIAERAIHGWERPIYQKGQLVGHERCFDNNLLLRLAARLDPAWREKQGLEVKSASMAASLTLTPEQVLGLPEALQRKVVEIVEALSAAERKEEGDGGA